MAENTAVPEIQALSVELGPRTRRDKEIEVREVKVQVVFNNQLTKSRTFTSIYPINTQTLFGMVQQVYDAILKEAE